MKDNVRNIIKVLIDAYRCGYHRAGGNERARDDRDDMLYCILENVRRLDIIQTEEEDIEMCDLAWILINEETDFVVLDD